jgi:hypothetical protein
LSEVSIACISALRLCFLLFDFGSAYASSSKDEGIAFRDGAGRCVMAGCGESNVLAAVATVCSSRPSRVENNNNGFFELLRSVKQIRLTDREVGSQGRIDGLDCSAMRSRARGHRFGPYRYASPDRANMYELKFWRRGT